MSSLFSHTYFPKFSSFVFMSNDEAVVVACKRKTNLSADATKEENNRTSSS
jgi:hypothetical protein